MRRSLPKVVTDSLSPAEPAKYSRRGEDPRSHRLVMEIPLETATAVVGGGVEALTPDSVDLVRIPSIRGQLRGWWRALGNEARAQALFDAEGKLWGAVDLKDEKGNPTARKSLIGLDVQIDRPGTVVPAGWHPRFDDGRFRALPDWKDGPWIGYGLFPLQIPEKERKAASDAREGRLGTKAVREGVRFKLTIRVEGTREASGDGPDRQAPDLARLVATIWAWIHFGGLGARTTRGFGALAIRDKVTFRGVEGVRVNSEWGDLFAPCSVSDLGSRLRAFLERAGVAQGVGSPGWPLLRGARFLVGKPERSAHEAHRTLLSALHEFRQGPYLGRAGGSGGRPGRSYWPEADGLRRLAMTPLNAKFRLHPPPQHVRGAPLTTPRAAFGLPLNIGFKDGEDKAANGSVVNDRTDRYTSAVRLCPVVCASAGAVPVVVVLCHEPPSPYVKLDRENLRENREGHAAALLCVAGAGGPIDRHLRATSPPGDAVAAWCKWLTQSKGFVEL